MLTAVTKRTYVFSGEFIISPEQIIFFTDFFNDSHGIGNNSKGKDFTLFVKNRPLI